MANYRVCAANIERAKHGSGAAILDHFVHRDDHVLLAVK
jgi:hypothetical protein